MSGLRTLLTVLCLATLALVGCSGDLTSPWEVKEPRLILARVEIDGDTEARARPRVGDTFHVRVYLASNTKIAAISFAGALCLSAKLPTGDLACVLELPLDNLDVQYDGGDSVLLSAPAFAVPQELVAAAAIFGDLGGVSLFSAACIDGTAERISGTDAAKDSVRKLFRCTENAASAHPAPLLSTYTIPFDLDQAGQLNHRPSFDCSEESGPCAEGVAGTPGEGIPGAFVLEHNEKDAEEPRAVLWEPIPEDFDVEAEDCSGQPALPLAYAGDEYRIRVRFDAADRETYTAVITDNFGTTEVERREDLVLSEAFTTHGGGSLDSFSTLIDRDVSDDAAEAEITYSPPAKIKDNENAITESGRVVKFFFAVRDGRGGVDFATRALCVMPPRP
ncbi:MAG: hypothetical protein RL385_4744 [Pseudomonadota bacterium]|jgi:hypothetical protein